MVYYSLVERGRQAVAAPLPWLLLIFLCSLCFLSVASCSSNDHYSMSFVIYLDIYSLQRLLQYNFIGYRFQIFPDYAFIVNL